MTNPDQYCCCSSTVLVYTIQTKYTLLFYCLECATNIVKFWIFQENLEKQYDCTLNDQFIQLFNLYLVNKL